MVQVSLSICRATVITPLREYSPHHHSIPSPLLQQQPPSVKTQTSKTRLGSQIIITFQGPPLHQQPLHFPSLPRNTGLGSQYKYCDQISIPLAVSQFPSRSTCQWATLPFDPSQSVSPASLLLYASPAKSLHSIPALPCNQQ
jgi:hypothetical protein